MKKKMLAPILAGLMALSLCACGGGETAPEGGEGEAATPVDLAGEWKMSNAKSDAADMIATISADSISVSFVVDGDSYLYWSGSYVAPTEAGDTYKWTSKADGKAASAMMGSSDDTKDFSYDKGTLSFDVTIDGETATVEMDKQSSSSTEPNAGDAEDKTSGKVGDFDVKIGDCTFGEDYDGNKMIVISYDFTNNGDQNATPIFDLVTKAFQDGVSLETAIAMDSSVYDAGICQKEIQPGGSIENCQIAFVLTSESPVEFEIGPFLGDSVLFKTFEVTK